MTTMPDPQTSARVDYGGKSTAINPIYNQANRPQFHFTSQKGWLNDPNGMVFDGKNYHLYFQHNPESTEWGNMTWGHAVSPDMVHWKQPDHAIKPYSVDGRQGTIYSGSAIVDQNNVLGKQVGDTKTIVAMYTFASDPKFYQSMAYSTDGGVTYTKWNEGRAVIPHQGYDSGERDPRIFWNEESGQFVTVLWLAQNPGRFRFFVSKNLIDWKFASDFVAPWPFECPDIFFLPLDGDKSKTKCVITDAGFTYEVGSFDGTKFTSESGPQRNVIGHFYAAQTFTNTPGRTVQIGWMRSPYNSASLYGTPFNQQMSVPNELTLRSTPGGMRLFSYPAKELNLLHGKAITASNLGLSSLPTRLPGAENLDLVDISLEIRIGSASQIDIEVPRTRLRYDARINRLTHIGVNGNGERVMEQTLQTLVPHDGKVTLRLLVDRMSLEVYANGGEQFGAHYLEPTMVSNRFSVTAVGAGAVLEKVSVTPLKSAWN